MKLVIVESPAKAKTIEKYLGKGFMVRSSMGHIRDLPKKNMGVAIDKDFAPEYEISPTKKKLVSELRSDAKKADEVILATDEDREGEAIAWHLCAALKLDPKTTKRIVFHEITKTAIEEAMSKPRTVDLPLVDAQQARRVLDRLVGYELSPVLWRKVQRGLSAGRVQSVAVRLIVEREREIRAFESSLSFKVFGEFLLGNETVPAELDKQFKQESDAEKFLTDSKDAIFTVASVDQKPGMRNPSAPFTTSTLQQEAARRIGLSVKTTMQLAQRLYESGAITYMRTDSTNLSQQAIGQAGDYIKKTYGDKYHRSRQYATKSSGAQEAHEAIRPTDFSRSSAGADDLQKKVYDLIWRRALASQMAPAQTEKTVAIINNSKRSEYFKAEGEILRFDGFYKVYGGSKEDKLLPALNSGDVLERSELRASSVFTRPPARFSEASLVKHLEEKGIGRPSTYAPTISTIQDRGYIEKSEVQGREQQQITLVLTKDTVERKEDTVITGADKNKLLPTPIADMTTDFLVKYFKPIVDYDFTAKAEEEFDQIADGKHEWQVMIKDFYTKNFHPLIEASADATRSETSQMREIGVDPKSGEKIFARFGKFGPMLQKGEGSEEKKPAFAPMPEGAQLTSVTLEQALVMFELPRNIGTTEDGLPIVANIGRFGPYVQVEKKFVSIKGFDPFSITEAEARELITAKATLEANKIINEFAGGIKVLNGQYGPYITDGKKNAKIPKDTEPASLTLKQCKELLAAAPAKGKGRRFVKRKK